MTSEASPAASYATATENLRTAARWLLTAAAAAGAVMVAGVQLTSIGSLGASDWPRLAAAATGLAAGLGSAGYMIFQASLLLTDEWITLAQMELASFRQLLSDSGKRRDTRRLAEINRIYDEIQDYQDEFYRSVACSITDLYQRLIKANDDARESPSPEHSRAAAEIKAAVDVVVEAANYSRTRARFAGLRRRLALAGSVFVAGIVVFAYAANPPKAPATSATTARPSIAQSSPAPKAPAPRPGRSRLRLGVPDKARPAGERPGR